MRIPHQLVKNDDAFVVSVVGSVVVVVVVGKQPGKRSGTSGTTSKTRFEEEASEDILPVDVERKRGYAQANASHRPHRANETERKRRFALVQRASVLHAR